MADSTSKSALGEVARLFLRLGLTAFGGPAAHLGLMQHEAVERRGWMSMEHFLDLVGACNLLPGPSSTQVAMALGYTRAGWMGLLAAGTCFIFPASVATLALAWAYVRYGSLPQTQGLLYGAKPVMVAIIVQAVWNLGRMAFRRWPLAVAGLACFIAAVAGAPPFAILLVCGGLTLLAAWQRNRRGAALGLAWMPLGVGGTTAGAAALSSIFLVFLKLGVVVFGSGYVLLAFLKADLVDRLHWITNPQLLDAVTAGQLTPGPVFATATFLGYLLRGWAGAGVATAAIFLPSFLMAGLVGALAGRIRKSVLAGAFLDGVNAAAVALMASVAITLGRATLVDGWTWALGLVSAVLLLRFRINSTWLICGGAALGILLRA
ncbi:MAG: chromate efflux transporter [Terracidiphilus sp.]|nr:chromate efflux transporter [Terracidiphilus sp.]